MDIDKNKNSVPVAGTLFLFYISGKKFSFFKITVEKNE
jgi:hypothetical protein